MNEIKEFFIKNRGYGLMKDMKASKIHTRTIKKAIEKGIIEKIKPGLYKLIDYNWDENELYLDVCKSNSKAVICLLSALSYYDLTDFNPAEIFIALPQNSIALKLDYPPVRVFYFSPKTYESGVEELELSGGEIKIYCVEKTICDIFRFRNKLGEDIAIESLKRYLKRQESNYNKLIEYAEICRVKKIIMPYLKALHG